ncbi:MAG: GGDEF domain-containing phosphodiesterase [Pseudomonadota bacterium]
MAAFEHKDVLALVELAEADSLYDQHGEAVFELLRRDFMTRLQQWVRSEDKCASLERNRCSVVLKSIAGIGQLELAAAKLKRLFSKPYTEMGRSIPLTIVTGFAPVDESDKSQERAMRNASTALRAARVKARDYEVYQPGTESSLGASRETIRALELAVERGELELYYQPKVHAGFRNITGAEALIRWHREGEGIVTPDQFIPIAEKHGVIRHMTWWAIKSAIARLARWESRISLAVNVTPTLVLDDEIYWVIRDSLEIYEINPACFTLEVTEGVMVEKQNSMLEQLAKLRKLGIKIAIDDFGTGFSSLAYFRDLPADEIKIDKSFVMHMRESARDFAIVNAVIDLAHNFSLQVVAEGVEDEFCARQLADMRCDYLQGYLIDKPLPLEDFERRYLSQSEVAQRFNAERPSASRLH